MAEAPKPQSWGRQELLSLLSLSGTLAGLCITIIAFMNVASKGTASVVDDMLIACSAAFLGCIYLIFWALKTRNGKWAALLVKIVDVLFLLALSSMTVAGFIMVYTIW